LNDYILPVIGVIIADVNLTNFRRNTCINADPAGSKHVGIKYGTIYTHLCEPGSFNFIIIAVKAYRDHESI
jgi:large-conductance mechanosensitive channel